jgi:hypothetical protein
MKLIDNGAGFALMNGGQDLDKMVTKANKIIVYGETENRDCPTENWCHSNSDKDICITKSAMLLSDFTQGKKDPYPRSQSSLPIHKIKTYASWGGQPLFQYTEFHDFTTNKTYCGMK